MNDKEFLKHRLQQGLARNLENALYEVRLEAETVLNKDELDRLMVEELAKCIGLITAPMSD